MTKLRTIASALAGSIAVVALVVTLLVVTRIGGQPTPLQLGASPLVFTATTNVQFSVSGGQGLLRWSVINAEGDRVADGSAESSQPTLIEPKIEAVGYYSLRLRDQDSQVEANFLVTGEETDVADPFFSVATHWGKPSFAATTWPLGATLPLMRNVGFTEFRDETEWSSVERERGVYTIPQHSQEMISETSSAGMKMMLVADYGNPRVYGDMQDVLTPPTSRESVRGYVAYINSVLDSNENIDKVEVWNEFNRPFRNTSTCQSGTCYAELVKAVYVGVKPRHPDVAIVAGNTASTPLPWFEDFINAGGLRSSDAISTHGYANDTDSIRRDISGLDRLIKKNNNGRSKPIIVSEIGISNTTSKNPRGNVARVQSENQAAAGLVRIFATLRSIPSVSQVVWYDGVDDGTNPDDGEDNFGLFRQPSSQVGAFEPKPAAASMYRVIRELAGSEWVSTSTQSDNLEVNTFKRADGTLVRVIFERQPFDDNGTSSKTARVTIAKGSSARVLSMTGSLIDELPTGQSEVTVGASPIFIIDVPKRK